MTQTDMENTRSDSAVSMESLDFDAAHVIHTSIIPAQYPTSTSKNHYNHLNASELERLGLCEDVDDTSDDDAHHHAHHTQYQQRHAHQQHHESSMHTSAKPPRVPTRQNSAYQNMRTRMQSMPLAIPGMGAMDAVATSPVSGGEKDDDDEEDEDDDDNHTGKKACNDMVVEEEEMNSLKRSKAFRKMRLAKLDFSCILSHENDVLMGECGDEKEEVETPFTKARRLTHEISRVRPYLFVGDIKGAGDVGGLKARGVTHVVNLAGAVCDNAAPDQFGYLKLKPTDCANEDLSCLFLPIAKFIDDARAVNGKVFMHCYRGVSRSCAAAMAYLMLDEGLSSTQAMEQVSKAREIASPNFGFQNSLVALERQQRKGHACNRIYRVQVDTDNVVVLKRLETREVENGADDHVLVMEKAMRQGVEMHRGARVSDAHWHIILPSIERFAEQIERNCRFYPGDRMERSYHTAQNMQSMC